jgi:hypothetical protein
MVLFTFNSVPTPNNPFVVVNETETVSQTNGDKTTTVIDINYPKTNVQGSVNAIVNTSVATTTPETQATHLYLLLVYYWSSSSVN